MASLLLPCVATGVSLRAVWCLSGVTPWEQPWPSAVPLPLGRHGLSARRMAVLSTFRAPTLCRHVHHELLRSAVLDVTPKIPATACHQRHDVERYSKYRVSRVVYIKQHYLYTIIGEGYPRFSLPIYVENNSFNRFFLTMATGRSICAEESLEKCPDTVGESTSRF
jgi:hypothetical protein